jgi:hypothetical protein
MNDYKLYQSDYIVKHQQSFLDQLEEIKLMFGEKDTTELYQTYNIFSVTAGSLNFYHLFHELSSIIRKELPEGPLWMQAWVNIHDQENVLDWHNHYWDYHGYISIDPKDTVTEFEEYHIQNKVGQIYFGPGKRNHRVKNLSSYNGKRVTIGYDVTTDPIMNTGCLSFIPL